MKGLNNYAFFWGCSIQARFPFMEKSVRVILDALKVPYKDIDGFTCCPEKVLVKNLNGNLWKVLAARNVALAESQGLGIMTICTGCYSSLKTASSSIKCNPNEQKLVNEKLKEVGLSFNGNGFVKHFIEYLHDECGMGKIKDKMVKSLRGLKFAIHGGCHLVRPSKAVHFDHPLKPKKFDKLVEVLGGKVINSKLKNMCCGGSVDRAGQHDNALKIAKKKLDDFHKSGVDAIVLVCPECFKVFDNYQFLLTKNGSDYSLPVITLPELMGLTFGYTPETLGMDFHRMDTAPFIEKFERVNKR